MRFVKTAESIFNIPSGFTRVAYLESTGTQYIDTGYEMSNDSMTFDGNIMWTNKNSTANFFFGYRLVNSPVVTGDMRAFFVYCASATPIGRLAIRYGVNADNSTQAISLNTKYNISWDGSNLKINGTTYDTLSQAYTPASYKSMFLFWCNCEDTYSADVGKFIGRIYNWQIKQDGVLVRDFVPCIDPLGRACMYDLVEKKAYYNQGTGTFTAGRKIIPVDYLESTGTQYIDTGHAFTDNFAWEIDFDGIQDNTTIFGGRTSSVRTALLYQRFDGVYTTTCPIAGLNGTNTPFQLSDLRTGRHTVKMAVNANKGSVWEDGVQLYNETSFTGTYISGTTQALFADNFGSSVSEYTSSKVYALKMWQGSTLVRDFIPCKDENNVGFMFDTLSGTVYENAGTGAFIVGGNKYNMKLRLIRDNILPTGYTQVEYLESTGTQYIYTGIKPNQNTKVECVASWTYHSTTTSNPTLYGARSDLNTFYEILQGISYHIYYQYGSGSPYITDATIFGRKAKYVTDANKFYVDDILRITATASTFTNTQSLCIFCLNNNGTIERFTLAKMYYFKVLDNGTLVRDFIPAIDPSGTPCMYDLVTRTPFYNAGTGTFITGKPVLPIVRFPVDPIPGYKTVNYIESTGTQYIDTGILTKQSLKIKSKIDNTGATASEFAYGVRKDTATITCATGSYINGEQTTGYFRWGTSAYSSSCPYGVSEIEQDSSGVMVNGIMYLYNSEQTVTSQTGYTITLFAGRNSTTGVTANLNGKIFYLKIWDNNILVRNFIPVVRLLDNKAGMWDTVTKQFYGNLGTGNFNYG